MRRFDADSVKRDEYERVRDDLADVMGRSSSIDADLNNIRKQLSSVSGGFSEDKLKSLREELDTKRDARGKVNADLAAVKGDIKLYDSNIQSTSRTIDMVKKQIDARKTLLSELEISTSSVEVLGKFRSHMILSSIPQVTDYASDLVMKITDGRFTSIHIDSKFAINVERDDGIVENVSQLSGGEMSLVAICLRLAISVMLSNGSPSLLILDEILTAMDEDRASEILTAMQKLSNGGQIIIVAHNEIIKSIADKVVEL
jgi:exonuclease SbcC